MNCTFLAGQVGVKPELGRRCSGSVPVAGPRGARGGRDDQDVRRSAHLASRLEVRAHGLGSSIFCFRTSILGAAICLMLGVL